MKILSIIAVLAFLIVGCAQPIVLSGNPIPNVEIFHDKNLSSGYVMKSIPFLDTENTVDIGVSMYEKIYQIEFDTYKLVLQDDFSVNLPGTIFSARNDRNKYVLYVWGREQSKAMCIIDHMRRNVCLVDINNDSRFEFAAFGHLDTLYKLDNQVRYTIHRDIPVFDNKSFRYMALYQGRSGNKIKISYREFLDNMARPAFTQDIEYELADKNETIIGFKGLRMKVLEATNTNITYIVIKDYD